MKTLPQGLKPYKRTPEFSSDTVPPALQRDHATKQGVWGLIHVLKGELVYRIVESREEHHLVPGHPGVIQPQVSHSVELVGDSEFFVEFWIKAEAD